MSKQQILLLAALATGVGATPAAQAFIACNFNGGGAITATAPLQGGNISVGPDTPDGTVLFRQYFRPSYTHSITCNASPAAYTWQSNYLYLNLPLPEGGWSGLPRGGKVYETGVPGIGVYAWYSGNAFPFTKNSGTTQANVNYTYSMLTEFDISFIKTGPVSPGVISGSNLPTVISEFTIPGNGTMRLSTIRFSGTVNVVSGTCTTPDVNVDMGKYNINSDFTGKGDTTPWQNASILLQNCPRFYGTIDDGRNNFYSDSGSAGAGKPKQNTVVLTFTSANGTSDAANGIINIQGGSGAASGVGVQLAYGTDTNPSFVNLSTPKIYAMPDSSSTAWQLPLVARYIQTADSVTPGRADGKVVFTITYK
ncbi:type 1 fimbrial protein [Enterobacter cloacae subsp. cloacae]|uniref:fimbrial protein n=1 Tax=Enterobacter cloacae TaxID=550 RepID=UPI001C5B5647|nr:fimbrial protein [Enterobacter cloacae]MBW4204109.1 type 1 fimbrial protein [Enterobacter cloacae subsp. cloacae]